MEIDHARTRWHQFSQQKYFQGNCPLKKIVFEHFNPHFFTTVIFESKGGETLIDWSMLFDTEEMRDIVVKQHKADEGLKQNVEKLETYLSNLLAVSKSK